ncbi:transglutaminase family protein [bacterium]|nr:transglutaminase family protein [bacterium]
MQYDLRLMIRYEFDRPTGAGRQQLRIQPAQMPPQQSLLSCEITLTPEPAERRDFTDFFGTRVLEVVMPPGLKRIEIAMKARVVRLSLVQELDISPPLARLRAELEEVTEIGAASPHHFLWPSPRIPADAAIAAFARKAVEGAETTRAAIGALGNALHDFMTFDAKATEVDTPPAVAFALKRGVCQDFAQIMIAGLRSLGIPAAYVGGFLRTLPPPGKSRLEGADAMHAWVRAWAGAEAGWIDHDPTNACFVDTDHIAVGHGRDYSDVAPVTGALRMDGGQKGSHSVDLVEFPPVVASPAPPPRPAPRAGG